MNQDLNQTDHLLAPLEPPQVSENLLADPEIARILEPPSGGSVSISEALFGQHFNHALAIVTQADQ